MKISGTFGGKIANKVIQSDGENDGSTARVDVAIVVKHEDAEKFGEWFEQLAFSSMVEEEGRIFFLQDRIKPGKAIVYPAHTLKIDKHKLSAQPVLFGIKTGGGEAAVTATLRLSIDSSRTQLLAALEQACGKSVKVEFLGEEQPGFEFTKGGKGGAGMEAKPTKKGAKAKTKGAAGKQAAP